MYLGTRLLTGVVVGGATLALAGMVRGEDAMRYQDVTLAVTVAETNILGQDITITLALKSKSEQSLYSIDTADLTIELQDVANLERKYVCERGRLRSLASALPDGTTFHRTIEVKKRSIEMTPGGESKVNVSVLSDFSTRLSCGTYTVSAVYEGEVKANTTFAVVVDSARSVPALIDLVADPDEWTRGWARDRLFSVIERPAWKPSRADSKERIDAEVGALRKWWKDNKERILLEESHSPKTEVVGRQAVNNN